MTGEQLSLFDNMPEHRLHYDVKQQVQVPEPYRAKCRCGAHLLSMSEIQAHKDEYGFTDEGPRR